MKKDTIKIDFTSIKTIINDILIQIWVIINPRYWIMNNSYSAEWNKELKFLMKNHVFVINDYDTKCTAKLGSREIWIANHPYASFTRYSRYSFFGGESGRPSRLTIYKAKQKLERDVNILQPIEVSDQVMTNPCGEIMLGGGESMLYESTFTTKISGQTTSHVGELSNGIPKNWDEEL